VTVSCLLCGSSDGPIDPFDGLCLPCLDLRVANRWFDIAVRVGLRTKRRREGWA
jgi:hypothetical protein